MDCKIMQRVHVRAWRGCVKGVRLHNMGVAYTISIYHISSCSELSLTRIKPTITFAVQCYTYVSRIITYNLILYASLIFIIIFYTYLLYLHAETPMAEADSVSVGVLCIQGAFIEHIRKLNQVGEQGNIPLSVTEVRTPDQLSSLDGLIIPGGESTTLSVFLNMNGFEECVRRWICDEDRPGVVWGTCAGLILLADELTGQKKGGQVTVSGCVCVCDGKTFFYASTINMS